MKKLLLGCVSSLAVLTVVGSAAAADLRMPVKAPPIAPVFSWTGCYVGGYAGGAWQDSNGTTFTDLGNATFRSYSGGVAAARILGPHSWSTGSDSGFIGGGTLGCNWEPVGSPFVLGVEGEFGYMHLSGQAFDPTTIQATGQTTPDVLGSAKVGDWYGMITGRLGYAWDRTLLYVKGGAAFVPTQASVLDQCNTGGCGNWTISTSGNNTNATWTIGGGLEWAFAQNWSVKAEYMFISLRDNGQTICGSAIAPSGATVGGGPFCFNNTFGGINTAKIGVNYRFVGSGY